MRCFDWNLLIKYYNKELNKPEGAVSVNENIKIENHLQKCKKCQENLLYIHGLFMAIGNSKMINFKCLTDGQINAYHDGMVDRKERESIEKHLNECNVCLNKLIELKQTIDTIKEEPFKIPEWVQKKALAIHHSPSWTNKVKELLPIKIPLAFRYSFAAGLAVLIIILGINLFLKQGPSYSNLDINNGIISFKNNQYEEAVTCFKKIKYSKLRKRRPDIVYMLSYSYFHQKNYETAFKYIEDYIKNRKIIVYNKLNYLKAFYYNKIKKNTTSALKHYKNFILQSRHRYNEDIVDAVIEYYKLKYPQNNNILKITEKYYKFTLNPDKKIFKDILQLISKIKKSNNAYTETEPSGMDALYFKAKIYSSISAPDLMNIDEAKNIFNLLIEKADKERLFLDDVYFSYAMMIYPFETKKAERFIDKCLEINKYHLQAKYYKGIFLREAKKEKKAFQLWCEVIDYDEDNYLAVWSKNKISDLTDKAVIRSDKFSLYCANFNDKGILGDITDSVFIKSATSDMESYKLGIKNENNYSPYPYKILEGAVLVKEKTDKTISKYYRVVTEILENIHGHNFFNYYYEVRIVEEDIGLNAEMKEKKEVIININFKLLNDIMTDKTLKNKEDILAFYIGHEMAHIENKHYLKCHKKSMSIMKAREGIDKYLNNKDKTELLKENRRQELEADRYGIKYMAYAGYDPQGAIEGIKFLSSQLGEINLGENHPTWKERTEFLLDFWLNDIKFKYNQFEIGVKYGKDGDWRKAVEYFKTCEEIFDSKSDIYIVKYNYSLSYLKQVLKRSGFEYKFSEKILSKLGTRYRTIGIAARGELRERRTGLSQKKLGYLSMAIQILNNVENWRIKNLQAVCYLVRGYFDENHSALAKANNLFKEILNSRGRIPQVVNNYGIYLLVAGKSDKAIKQFQKVEKDVPEALYNLGILYMEQEQYEKARKYLNAYKNKITNQDEIKMVNEKLEEIKYNM